MAPKAPEVLERLEAVFAVTHVQVVRKPRLVGAGRLLGRVEHLPEGDILKRPVLKTKLCSGILEIGLGVYSDKAGK
jgi:hypothetical protein